MCRLTVALCPLEIAELLEEIERVLIQTLDHRQCVDELAAVVVDFHHLLHVFELQHIVKMCIRDSRIAQSPPSSTNSATEYH